MYKYIWHDVDTKSLILSGIKFCDFAPVLVKYSGLLLLKHYYEGAEYNPDSMFACVNVRDIESLNKENIYSWGDFYWTTYQSEACPELTDLEITELQYFIQNAQPMGKVMLSTLGNDFLIAAHDDGWFLRAYYDSWEKIKHILALLIPELSDEQLKSLYYGTYGFWIQNGKVTKADKTFNVDEVINRNRT